MGGEPQPFPLLADGIRFPRLGETTEVQISVIENAEVSFDQYHQSFSVKQTQRQKYVPLQFLLNKALNSRDGPVSLLSLVDVLN